MFDIRRAAVHHALGGTAVVGLPKEVFFLPDGALKGVINMMFHSRAAQTPILAAGSALALMTAVLVDSARAETNLDASYTISFARIRVGDITATIAFGDSEYAISANGRAGGVIKVLLDGEGSFTTRGKITDGYPVPTAV